MAHKLAQESEGIIGYWFAREPVLPNGDGRSVVIGETLAVDPPLEMCRQGLHGSEHPFDALLYAPGPLLYRCRFSGEILRDTDKLCASERTVLAVLDFTPQLWLFARRQALSVIHLWDAPAVVRKFLETGEKSLRNAAEAAAARAARPAHGAAATRAAGAARWAAMAAAEAARAVVSARAAEAARAVVSARAIARAGAARTAARAVVSARATAEAARATAEAAMAAAEDARAAARAAFMRIVEDAFAGHEEVRA